MGFGRAAIEDDEELDEWWKEIQQAERDIPKLVYSPGAP
jgi:hypothetical protein